MLIVAFILIALVVFYVISQSVKNSALKKADNKLYVGNLDYRVRGAQLHDIFSQYGNIESVRLVRNPHTGRSKGFAFVAFNQAKEARKALKLSGKRIKGRSVVVRVAKARADDRGSQNK